ncbi:MAG: sigma-70 family RNA polymerase sigma factor [Armatimonadetes bacterium]|nr:sigma-70 family RNA polymerase sigma factor [Armatimonadota bacterium]
MADRSPETTSPLSEPSRTLLERARGGDSDALTELLEPYQDVVFRLAFRISGHAQDAEDLAQEAFIRMVGSLPAWRGDSSFSTWVYRVTLNVCLTSRKKRREATVDISEIPLADEQPDPEAQALICGFQETIREEVRRLPTAFREAVTLRLSEELSYAEIAEVLGIPLNTALTRVHRGMKRLRERLKPLMDEGR